MWSLESPYILLLLLTIPPLIYYIHFRKQRGGMITFSFRIWGGDGFKQKVNTARIINIFLWFIFWCGFASLIIALGGPRKIEKEKIYLTKGVDMIIVLDESGSMSAPDFKPSNRFESAKEVIRKFTQSRENDQIGLVTFGSEAVLRVPPTLDYTILEQTLKSLKIMELGDGTAIGMGIAVAVLHLRSSKAKDKIIILLTDGVNNEGEVTPEQAASAAIDMDIKIYTVGIGRLSEMEWIYQDTESGLEYKGTSGEYDEELLKRIARLTGGKFYYAGDPRVLSAIFEEIDSMEKTDKRVKLYVKRIPKHNIFLIIGILCNFISFLGRKWLLKEIF